MSIIFYSPKCRYCIELLNLIEQYNITIKKINISTLQNFPSFLHSVPTIITEGVHKPLIGEQALQWVLNYQYFNIGSNNIKTQKNVDVPYNSDLLEKTVTEVSAVEKDYCSINNSNSLIFPTLKDLLNNS
jgi:hypothetical protein